ncbi:LysR family transcriptional regulator [Pseudomaricurvus alkylphenolicus]|uniref:LysR family transcriptional regulator n=1 Tax=Pseudomaricurvus alkylphenolicus TaxID=1306991 RepID=UPI00141EB7EB|nr:LysR family transcriptional regulator [Pseudomaricurvus alkylphenolicus]NIB40524.1 LysR family transcriptional regulator [Pseudomaricurvus alkylphenolicus]
MQIEDLRVVLKVAEFRSITAAAANLDMRTATASAALKRVEATLGAELFIRTTRQLRLSNAGERYIPQCQQALLLLEQARHNMQEDSDSVEGEIRVAVSSDLGRNLVVPWLDEFMETYPKVSLRANISDSNIDFYRDAVDIAIRYGSPSDSNLYGFKICDVPRLLCATQGYLDQHGTPSHPHDLPAYNGLFYQLHDIIHDVWEFSHQGSQFKVKMSGNRASNDGDLVRRWCVAGKGLAAKSCLDVSADLLAGNIVSILPEYQPRPTELWLVCPSRQSITPAVRLLRDAVKEKCRETLQRLIDTEILDASVL